MKTTGSLLLHFTTALLLSGASLHAGLFSDTLGVAAPSPGGSLCGGADDDQLIGMMPPVLRGLSTDTLSIAAPEGHPVLLQLRAMNDEQILGMTMALLELRPPVLQGMTTDPLGVAGDAQAQLPPPPPPHAGLLGFVFGLVEAQRHAVADFLVIYLMHRHEQSAEGLWGGGGTDELWGGGGTDE